MKKIISVLLAIVMIFSMATVAFAEGEVTDDTNVTDTPADGENGGEGGEGEAEEEGELDWLLDLPFWTVKPAAKIAKIALKLVKVYVKLAIIFGIIEKDDITSQIEDLISGALQDPPAEDAPAEDAPAEDTPPVTDPVAA